MHGTWSDPSTWNNKEAYKLGQALSNNSGVKFIRWSGENNKGARNSAAISAFSSIIKVRGDENKNNSPIVLAGHSHGGNVAIMTANLLANYYKDLLSSGKIKSISEITLLTLNTPVRFDYQLNDSAKKSVNHFNVYNAGDNVQANGGSALLLGTAGSTYEGATNVEYKDFFQNTSGFNKNFDFGCSKSGHCGTASENINIWAPQLKEAIFYKEISKAVNGK